MRFTGRSCSLVMLLLSGAIASAGDGNRLAYLDEPCDPYYVDRNVAKLVTPQWVGKEGVEAVIVLSTDDLREIPTHENFLRPILQRLKQIDGRAPVSLMTNQTDPKHSQLQKWLQQGCSLEAHTWDHPCPLLQGGDLAAAKRTYDRSVDFMGTIANSRPVAFRMPCCDSMSSVSPRFFTEILGKTTPEGNFLAIDSSVFMVYTADDPELPRRLVLDADGQERFRKYVPTDRIMANLIEDYPYPYVVGQLCWEIPTLMPSDWDAQHRNGVCSPTTVRDLKAAVDATVIKRGIFALCFHTHGWIRNDQIVEMIDHAVARHGKKVKFLTFREVYDRLTKNLLDGQPLRTANGQDNGVRVLDVDNDAYMDVVAGNDETRQTRLWSPRSLGWSRHELPAKIVTHDRQNRLRDGGVRFGVLQPSGQASLQMVYRHFLPRPLHFHKGKWTELADERRLAGRGWVLGAPKVSPPETFPVGRRRATRLLDVDGDGVCELVDCGGPHDRVRRWSAAISYWDPGDGGLEIPASDSLADDRRRDVGLRFVDIDEDGRLDVVFSNAERYSVHLFTSMDEGWSRKIISGKRGDGGDNELPPIVRSDGTNNGAWFKHRHVWVQNEDTGGKLPGHVFSRHFTQLLDGDHEPPARSPQGSLKSMLPRPGFTVELVAAEPDK